MYTGKETKDKGSELYTSLEVFFDLFKEAAAFETVSDSHKEIVRPLPVFNCISCKISIIQAISSLVGSFHVIVEKCFPSLRSVNFLE